jgi:hypothetical protein
MAFVEAFGVAMTMAASGALIGALGVLRIMPANGPAPDIECTDDIVSMTSETDSTSGSRLQTIGHMLLSPDK